MIFSAKHISKSYGKQAVLKGASLALQGGDKAALVGPNGAGKTTLLKVLARVVTPDTGELQASRGTKVGYLPQEVTVEGETVGDYVGSDPRLPLFFRGFGIEDIALQRDMRKLSGGEKGKIALIKFLLSGHDVLLLDEPTNNLDLPALMWLEEYIKNSAKTFLIVSHDRRFVDALVTRVFEVDRGTKKLNEFTGNYTSYLAEKAKELERRKAAYERQEKKKGKLRAAIQQKKERVERNIKKGPSDKDKMASGYHENRATRKLSMQTKALTTRIKRLNVVEKPPTYPPLIIELTPEAARAKHSIILKGKINLEIPFGRRVALLGKNGAGKTTFLQTIAGEHEPEGATRYAGPALTFGNLTQAHENLPREQKVVRFLEHKTKLEREFIFNILRIYGFHPDEAKKEIANLSPGGRARLLIAYFAALSVNVLLLDEPTNHLDEEALRALEEVLKTYKGTVVLVSHDRFFLERAKIDYWYEIKGGAPRQIVDLGAYEKRIQGEIKKTLALLKKVV